MAKYEVIVDLGSFLYEVEAPSEEHAASRGLQLFEDIYNDQRELQNQLEY